MSFKILYVTATRTEGETLENIRDTFSVRKMSDNFEIILLVAGVGSISTAWTLNKWIALNGKPDLAINGGIAGSYKDEFPYKNGLLYSDTRYSDKMKGLLKPVRAITVNTATGSETSRVKLLKKFNPDIETMEGATFFYICSRENIPFLALRAVSNKVEPRNKNNWNIALALNNLSEKLIDVLLTL